jgi:hypothetical protein
MIATNTSRRTCECGCSHGKTPCKFDCLVRPNFYAGQLLTDGNLKDLMDWVQGKAALQRFREGWGVVCGLPVRGSTKPKECSRVYVGEGYAVDCCGRDIVVCDQLWYDFKCDDASSEPCCGSVKPKPAPPEPPPAAQPTEGEARIEPASAKLGCIPVSELRAFDLFLAFDEKLTGGQRAPSRGGKAGECQFTRVRETANLYATEVDEQCADSAEAIDVDYRAKLKAFLEALRRSMETPKTLLAWVERQNLLFCFVRECLCEMVRANQDPPQGWQTDLGFYLVQDYRNQLLACACESCTGVATSTAGVPIARVWIWDKRDKNIRICRVALIDTHSPYRRVIHKDCWQADPGCVNVARYVWQLRSDVEPALHQQGFTNLTFEPFDRASILRLADAPDQDLLCAASSDRLVIRTVPDLCGRDRVVTFSKGAAA